jgi:NAD(P)-dependent dehydrogenase (short-subunit alcohol dehydrogenase family)
LSTEENRKRAIAFVEAMACTGIDLSVVTDDAQWWVPGTGWLSRAQDIAAAAAWLISEEAGFITGSDLRVDGGTIASRRWQATS